MMFILLSGRCCDAIKMWFQVFSMPLNMYANEIIHGICYIEIPTPNIHIFSPDFIILLICNVKRDQIFN